MDTPLTPELAAHSRLRQTLILLAAIYLLSSLALLAWRALGLHEAEVLFLQGPGLRSSLLWGGGLPLEAVKQLLFGRGLVLLLPLLVLAEEGLWRGLLLSALLELGMAPAWAIPTGARAPPRVIADPPLRDSRLARGVGAAGAGVPGRRNLPARPGDHGGRGPGGLALGAHAEHARCQGIGSRLCQHSLQAARQLGFRLMQFNLVVSTNTGGWAMWMPW